MDYVNNHLILEQLERYHDEMARVLLKYQTRNYGEQTDDANILQYGYTYLTLLKPARDLLTAHKARINNPHKEDSGSVGSMPELEYLQLIVEMARRVDYPISHYGYSDFQTDEDVQAIWEKISGFKLKTNAAVKCSIGGQLLVLAEEEWDLQLLSPRQYRETTFSVGIRNRFGSVYHEFTEMTSGKTLSPIETANYMHLGTVTTDANGITDIDIGRVVRLDNYRLNVMPTGSSIPVTDGQIDAVDPRLADGW